MLSRTLYEAFHSIASGTYSDGRPIPPWAREFSAALERDESIWAAFALVATFAVETSQQLVEMQPGASQYVGGAYVHRTATGEIRYNLYSDNMLSEQIGRGVELAHAVELIVRRHPKPVFPPLPWSAV